MFAYQVHVGQSCANTNIKPMQQKSSFFSQDDRWCSHFPPHQCKTQQASENKNKNEDI